MTDVTPTNLVPSLARCHAYKSGALTGDSCRAPQLSPLQIPIVHFMHQQSILTAPAMLMCLGCFLLILLSVQNDQ